MYSALDIAKYIIDYSYDRNNSVSNLRLQKILYFVQAEFLVATGHPCFEETIQAAVIQLALSVRLQRGTAQIA